MRRAAAPLCVFVALLVAGCDIEQGYEPEVRDGDAERGRRALRQYECGACHIISGIRGARGQVGPPLTQYARHVYIAGKFPNEPETLVQWIVDPPSLAPQTAMPRIGLTERTARDMAAYLYTLE